MKEKSFILGIGSQRAGSTFIAKLLSEHPKVAIHPVKELHYFDTISGVREEKVLKDFSLNQLEREINRLCNSQKLGFVTPNWKWYLRTNLQLLTTPISNINYFDLFSDVKHNKNIKFIGESTPEYMLLEPEQIANMRKVVGNAYVIIICRHPVQRLISSFRLLIEYGRNEIIKDNKKCDNLLIQLIKKNDIWIKRQIEYNNYVRAIDNYSKFFKKVLVLSYDDVRDNPKKILERLSSFLEINFHSMSDFFEKKINRLQTKYSPSEEVISMLEKLFESQIKETEKLFSKQLIH